MACTVHDNQQRMVPYSYGRAANKGGNASEWAVHFQVTAVVEVYDGLFDFYHQRLTWHASMARKK